MKSKSHQRRHYVYIWEYLVPERSVAEFEDRYGPDGDWVRLLGKSDGYLSTELIKSEDVPQRYLTIDHWQSRNAYAEFRKAFDTEFNELDLRCEALTLRETKIGDFTTVG